jgi:hypothetical protein
LALYRSWNYATHEHLLSDDLPADIHPAVVRRIVIAQSLYATGAALCFINIINTRDGIAAIVPVPVNHAIAPGLCWGLLAKRMRHGDQRA